MYIHLHYSMLALQLQVRRLPRLPVMSSRLQLCGSCRAIDLEAPAAASAWARIGAHVTDARRVGMMDGART